MQSLTVVDLSIGWRGLVTELGSIDVPLVVDLDGTLISTDSLHETLLEVLRSNPLSLWRLPFKLVDGRAAVKQFLAGNSAIDVHNWPTQEGFLEYLQKEAAGGRRVVLATAADRVVAEAVASRFPFISDVIASDGTHNLKGRAKAERLCEEFPEGFIYAGNSAADLHVWRKSRHNIVVNAPRALLRRVHGLGIPLTEFAHRKTGFGVLRRSLRLHQWAKNALIFVPLVLGGKAHDAATWATAALGFIVLGLAASATYVVNDLWDMPSDRRHWSKRMRPLASGELSVPAAAGLVVVTSAAAFGLALVLGRASFAVLAIYVAVTLSYSFALKRIPILDVLVLATLFTLRLEFGIVLAQVRLSPWLLVFSMFAFMSLSMAKRHTEVLRMVDQGLTAMHGRGYVAQDAPLTLGIGLAAMLGAVLIFVLYLIEDAFPLGFYANPSVLWAAPIILFLFLGRVWLLCQRGQLRDDPVAFALKDGASLALGGLMVAVFAAAIVDIGLR